MSGQRGTGIAEARDDVDDAAGDARLEDQLAQAQRRQRRLSAGLRTTVTPAASAGASFHAAISNGKFHRII